MKYIKTIIFILLLINIFTVPSWAMTTVQLGEKAVAQASKAATLQASRLAAIQKSADSMIDTRISSLQQLLSHVTNDSKLPSDDVTSFTTDVNTTISNLQTLKAKIDADTDVTTAQADRKSIVTSYRIYLIFEPKLRLLIAVDNLMSIQTKLSSLSGQLTTLVTQLQSEGKDVTKLQTALTDINAKLSDANTQLTNAKSALDAITISQAGQQPFVTVKQDLTKVRQDYAAIRSDFATMRSAFKILLPKVTATSKPTEPTSSESAK